jgi:hypothetical protein
MAEPRVWTTPKLFLLIPPDLAHDLHEALVAFYAEEPSIEVIVDRRGGPDDRRTDATPVTHERRRNSQGLGFTARRAPQLVREAPVELPRVAWPHAERLRFVQRMEPVHRSGEQVSAEDLVELAAAGNDESYSVLYWRYFGRVYASLRMLVNDPAAAEALVGPTFARVFDELAGYQETRCGGFEVWLCAHARESAREYLLTHRRPIA